MKHFRGKIAFCIVAISASFFTTGCNQSSEVASPTSANGGAVNPTMDNSAPGANLKYTDISAEEAKTAKPLNLWGVGPMDHADTGMLAALKRSYLERGTPLMASQLELSYDFKSGDYKGDRQLLSLKSTGLRKEASTSAWDGVFSYQGYHNGRWEPWVGNGQWIGNPNGTFQTDMLSGWKIQTNVQYGVTPSIYWNIYWGGYWGGYTDDYGWTATYSWNDYGQSLAYDWNGFVANTRTAGYNICYEMIFANGADIAACNGYQFIVHQRAMAMKFMVITR